MDRVRTLARQRHFYTSEMELNGYGRVLMVGDEQAVRHVLELVGQHEAHTILDVTDEENRGT